MTAIGSRTQYLSLEQIDGVCRQVAARLLVGNDALVDVLRRELRAISANGLRSSALGQGLFGPHAPRPGLVAIAGPGGVGKTYFAELLARVVYGEHYVDHLIDVNCRAYVAGRFPPLPRTKFDGGPLAIVALEAVETLAQVPPVAALWADAIRHGRALLPVTGAGDQSAITQADVPFGRCLIVATVNVVREQVAHVGFHPPSAEPVGAEASARLIREALADLFKGDLAEVLQPDVWTVLPPLDRAAMRRLVDLKLASIGELLPRNSPPVEISEPAAARLVAMALDARTPNKTAALVELIHGTVEPVIDEALLRASAPIPLRVRVGLRGDVPQATAEPVPASL